MRNTSHFKFRSASQILSNNEIQNIKGGKRSHVEKLERKRFKRENHQIKKEQRLIEKLTRKVNRNHQ